MPKDSDANDEIDRRALKRLEVLQRQKMIEMFDFDPEERTEPHTKRKRLKTLSVNPVAPDPHKKPRIDKNTSALSDKNSKPENPERKQNSKSSLVLDDSISFIGDIDVGFGDNLDKYK